MTRSKVITGALVASAIFAGGVLVGHAGQAIQAPRVTVGSSAPNLLGAQKAILQAFNYLAAAQQSDHDQLGGHAANAGKLLDEANNEVALAYQYVSTHPH
jgi:hypothetical protein